MPLLGAQFDFKQKDFLEKRKALTTSQMPHIDLDDYPDGYEVWNLTERKWYQLDKEAELPDPVYGYFVERAGGSGIFDLGKFETYKEGEFTLIKAIRENIDANDGLCTSNQYKFVVTTEEQNVLREYIFVIINYSDDYSYVRETLEQTPTPSVTLIRYDINGKIDIAENVWLCDDTERYYGNYIPLVGVYRELLSDYNVIGTKGVFSVDWTWRNISEQPQTKFVIEDATAEENQLSAITEAFRNNANAEFSYFIKNVVPADTYSQYGYEAGTGFYLVTHNVVEKPVIPVIADEIEFIPFSDMSKQLVAAFPLESFSEQTTEWIPKSLFETYVPRFLDLISRCEPGTDTVNKSRIFKTLVLDDDGVDRQFISYLNIVTVSFKKVSADTRRTIHWRVFSGITSGLLSRVGTADSNNDIDWDYWHSNDSSISMDFIDGATATFISTDTLMVNGLRLVNTGEIKLWVNDIDILTIPQKESADSNTVFTHNLSSPIFIESGSIVKWTIARTPDGVTPRNITTY